MCRDAVTDSGAGPAGHVTAQRRAAVGTPGLHPRRIACALSIIIGLLGFLPVQTAKAQTKGLVVYVEGPEADAARRAVVDGLPAGTTLADDQEFRKELARQGQKKPFGRHIDSRSLDRVRKAASAVGASAVLLVRVRKADPRAALVLLVETSGNVGADHEIHFRADLNDEDRDDLRRSLENYAEKPTPTPRASEAAPPAVPPSESSKVAQTAQTAAPSAPLPTPSTPPVESGVNARSESAEAAARIRRPGPTDANAAATSLAEVALDGGMVGRRFEYRNGIASYPFVLSRPAMPVIGVNAKLFPLAAMGGAWGDFGLVGEYSVILKSNFAGMNPTGYGAGVSFRVHPGANPPVVLRLDAEYEFIRFGAEDAGGNRLPDVTYRSLRLAEDARIPIGRFSILAGTAVRATIDPSGISQQFYNPSGVGFDAHVGATVIFLPHFEARLVGSYTRYSFSFGPPAGAMFGSGNAVDQLFGVVLAVAYIY
jgi:hypothetical protein